MKPADEVDEPISVVEADPAWPALFTGEAARVRVALPPSARIEHVGSTSVGGLAGKPIVDLLVGTRDQAEGERVAAVLEDRFGYDDFGEIFIPGRRYLRRRGPPDFNLAIAVEGSPFFETQLAVRDYLRAHAGEARAYAAAKYAAFESGARRFSSYSQAKHATLESLMTRALAWASGAHQRRGVEPPP